METDQIMEAELKNLIKVSIYVTTCMTYAHFASARTSPVRARLAVLLPVFYLLTILPLSFSTIHLRGISCFFLAWLGIFKLALLAFGHGPLHPSLPLPLFISIASLPIKLRNKTKPSPPPTPLLKPVLIFASKATVVTALVSLYRYKQWIPRYAICAIFSFHFYLSIDLIFAACATFVAAVLDLEFEPQFNAPYLATSFKDFWSHRWNLMAADSLRLVVYNPVVARWGPVPGVLATFLASGIMHEVLFFYMLFLEPSGEPTCAFAILGLCLLAEGWVKRRVGWRLWPPVAVPLTVGLLISMAFGMMLRSITRKGGEEEILAEAVAVVEFLEEKLETMVGQVAWLVRGSAGAGI